MSADGSDVRQLTPDTMQVFPGHWSPDGRRIVFQVLGPAMVNAIMVQDVAAGSVPRTIDVAKGNQAPSWSPDGRKILFSSGTWPNLRLHVMNPDGTGKEVLAPGACPDGLAACAYGDPVWSPDGRQIAFVLYAPPGPRIYVMNADGSGARAVSKGPGDERPAWSPDGRRVAFQSMVSDPGGHQAIDAYIAIADLESGAITRVGSDSVAMFNETPSWFPDGRRLAVQSRRSGRWEVYVIDMTGKVLQQLTR
jgi:TolB protein